MSVNGSNNFLNIEDANLRVRNGSVHAQGMTIGGAIVSASHGLQSVSDTGNTTSNTLQFTNATTAFKATSNIELTSASKIIVESNVLMDFKTLGQIEFPGSTVEQEYPPRALTGYETLVEGHGAFVAHGGHISANFAPWRAFNKELGSAGNFWIDTGIGYSDVAPYGPLSTHSKTTLYDGSVLSGGWIDLICPYPIKLSAVSIAPRTNYWQISLQRGIILGSNNGEDWYQIDTIDYNSPSGSTGTTAISNQLTNFGLTSTSYYSHIRLVCTNLTSRYPTSGTSDMHWQMGELVYFGTPGPTTLDKGSLTLGRSLDVPRVSRYDVDTETPRPEKLLVDFDTTVNSSPTDISGKGNHGAFYNGGLYSPADKAFKTTNGGGNVRGSHGLIGTQPVHSHSVWFKQTTDATDYTWVCAAGTADLQQQSGVLLSGNSSYPNRITFDCYNGWVTSTVTAELNRWYHVVATFNGGTTFNTTNCRIYVDGVDCTGPVSEVYNEQTFNLQGAVLALGSTNTGTRGLTGLISNYKLYNVVLEPSEVQKLYRLGRTGRSMVISDTAVGIGKAPEAQLDVRGNLNVDGVITNQKPAFYAELSNASSRSIGPGVAVFNDVLYNRGVCYDASTGLFTAPITGAYKFHCYGYGQSTSKPFWVRPWLNGSYWARGPYSIYSGAGEWIVPMNAGDTLGMYLPSSNYAFYVGGDRHNGFSGYLVG